MTALPLADIRLDERCQPRVSLDPEVIDDYAAAMGGGAAFPPLTVYRDGETYWLADGFHRYYAARQAGATEITCDVKPGDLRAAILHSVSANAAHGLRRSNPDKRRAVETLLNDPAWSQWSNVEIAGRCAVSEHLVRSLRPGRSDAPAERTYTTKHGTVATMRTSNIGRRERIDEETGEIMGDPPAYDIVDPSDPMSFLIEPVPSSPDYAQGERIAREITAADALLRLAGLVETDPAKVGDDLALRGQPGRDVLERYDALTGWLAQVRTAVANTAYAQKGTG